MVHIKSPQVIRDRRRFKTTTPPSGEARVVAPDDAEGTIFPGMVRKWTPGTTETIFKDGFNNRKIGGDVLTGDIRGAYLVTLSLEERATCPATCHHWRTCYGNNMPQAVRWRYTPELLMGISGELDELCAKFPGVLVRLHVLGDFPDLESVGFWAGQLTRHRNLFCFGFTAHRRDGEIGGAIARTRELFPFLYAVKSRFSIRHSGESGPWGSFTIDYPTPRKKIGDAVVCPEQREAMNGGRTDRHCGSCALCRQSPAPVVFVEH